MRGMILKNSDETRDPLETLVKTLLDEIILAILNNSAQHGYNIIGELHTTFGVLLSPGTLYPLLSSLENEDLIEGKKTKRKKVYSITPKGRKETLNKLNNYKNHSETILNYIEKNIV